MSKIKEICLCLSVVLILSLTVACNPVDDKYNVSSEVNSVSSQSSKILKSDEKLKRAKIMSSDKIMPQFIDISLYDEENYSKKYLGKKFIIDAQINSQEFSVPCKISDLSKKGWKLVLGSQYDESSSVYACDSVDAEFENENGMRISAVFYNSTDSSIKLSKCNIVKINIKNAFYENPENYIDFNINGIQNKMAITDIIDILGTPSHFYAVSNDEYYLDYFVSEDDRRNGITVYINTTEDNITAIEFSNYNEK